MSSVSAFKTVLTLISLHYYVVVGRLLSKVYDLIIRMLTLLNLIGELSQSYLIQA